MAGYGSDSPRLERLRGETACDRRNFQWAAAMKILIVNVKKCVLNKKYIYIYNDTFVPSIESISSYIVILDKIYETIYKSIMGLPSYRNPKSKIK